MPRLTSLAFAAAALILMVSGCGTDGIANRIQEKSAVFAALPPEQQQDIRKGYVQIGYTAEMVYMALGQPSKVKVKDTTQGKVGVWIYHNFYPEGYEAAAPAEPQPAAAATPVAAKSAAHLAAGGNSAPAAGAVASDDPVTKPGPGAIKEHPIFSTTAVDRPDSKMHVGSFSDRSAAMDPLTVADMPSASLFVIFYEGRVIQMKLGQD